MRCKQQVIETAYHIKIRYAHLLAKGMVNFPHGFRFPSHDHGGNHIQVLGQSSGMVFKICG